MIRRILLAVIILDIPFRWDVYIGHSPELAKIGAKSGFCVSATTICLIALYAMWLPQLVLRFKSLPQQFFRMSAPLAVYTGLVALSAVWAYNVRLSLFEIFLLGQMFLLFVYIVGTLRTREDLQFVVTMLLVGLALEGALIVASKLSGGLFNVAGISRGANAYASDSEFRYRTGGTIGSPNVAASYLNYLLIPALAVLLTQFGRAYKVFAACALALGVAALIMTMSRGGWLAFGFSLVVFGVLASRRRQFPIKPVLAVAVFVALITMPLYGMIQARIFANEGSTGHSRITLMQMAQRVIQDHTLLGVGANNFAPVILESYVRPNFSGTFISTVHNKYLLVWAETGIAALAAFLWFLTSTIRRGWMCWTRSDPLLSLVALGFTVAIVGQMLHMCVDIFAGRPTIQMMWLVAGLLTAMYLMNDRQNQKSACLAPANS